MLKPKPEKMQWMVVLRSRSYLQVHEFHLRQVSRRKEKKRNPYTNTWLNCSVHLQTVNPLNAYQIEWCTIDNDNRVCHWVHAWSARVAEKEPKKVVDIIMYTILIRLLSDRFSIDLWTDSVSFSFFHVFQHTFFCWQLQPSIACIWSDRFLKLKCTTWMHT